MVFTPAFAIANDPNIYHEPDIFDGLRFYNLRQRSLEDEKKFQFSLEWADIHVLDDGWLVTRSNSHLRV